MKYGMAEGTSRKRSVCQGEARYSVNRSRRLWSALLRPTTVFDKMGKNATIQAHSSSAAVVLSIKIRISGAIATIGVTCSTMANGNRHNSTHLFKANSMASATPPTTASNNAPKVIFMVYSQLTISEPRLSHSVFSTSVGAGRM